MSQEPWLEKLKAGDTEAAWDLLIERYHRLIAATVRHYAEGYDEVMDIFAYVCESLRANDFARLRKFAAVPAGNVRFSTWLVPVVRNRVIDWFRKERGRKRLSKIVADLPLLQQHAFQAVMIERHTTAEAYELTRTKSREPFSFSDFLKALAEAQRAVATKRPGVLLQERAFAAERQARRPTSLKPDVTAAANIDPPDVDVIRRETRVLLREALDSIGDEESTALQLYVVDGLTAAEVARILHWKDAKTVYNRVYRSLAALRSFLDEKGVDLADLT